MTVKIAVDLPGKSRGAMFAEKLGTNSTSFPRSSVISAESLDILSRIVQKTEIVRSFAEKSLVTVIVTRSLF